MAWGAFGRDKRDFRDKSGEISGIAVIKGMAWGACQGASLSYGDGGDQSLAP
jgi:hypothetical protein